MKSVYSFIAVAFSITFAGVANAVTITQWTFETSAPSLSGASIGSISAEVGTGIAAGVHASASTVWSSPAGNGSAKSFSSNNWGQNDYLQFTTSTVGYKDISVSFDQTKSSTGPSAFKVAYSTNGTSFTDLASGSYTVIGGAAGSVTYSDSSTGTGWTNSKTATNTSFSFSLSAVTALNNVSNVYIRLIQTGTGIAGAGTNRVDNFTFSGTTVSAVPEPSTYAAILGGLALAGVAARRRRSV